VQRRSVPNHLPLAILLAFAPVVAAQSLSGRYIVELNTESVAGYVAGLPARNAMQSAAAADHRTRVRGEQQQLRRQLEQRQAQVLDSVDTVANALFVQVPDKSAAQLAALPGVKRVFPAVRKLHRVLDRAVLLHKIASSWNEIGADRAGLGVKIAIVDSGIDANHSGFQDGSLTPPESFPRANTVSDLAYTNGKVIVARSYVGLLQNPDPDPSARDHSGHGTAVAMAAAGVRNAGPLATITGVAPKAYLGNYKIFGSPGYNDTTSDDVILKAIDDAVIDGMDIINLSLCDDVASRLEDDVVVQAIERASAAGVIVVAGAGNNGHDPNTISSPATAPSAIAVGASTNDRTFAASVDIAGLPLFGAGAVGGQAPSTPITALLFDVSTLDESGLACSALPANSLTGRVALIQRGTCTYETKVTYAQQAGAVAAVIYATKNAPHSTGMALGSARLPAATIRYDDGIAIKQSLASQSSLAGTLRFTPGPVSSVAGRLTYFSAEGPNVDGGIKPDVTAVGGDIYVATQTLDSEGDMYDSSGYTLVDGTSFATPLVAGAAALLKSARPGLSVNQYRSLLINTASEIATRSGQTAGVQQAGAGLLDVSAALHSTVTVYPVSLSFGSGGPDPRTDRVLTITNLGASPETFSIAVSPRTGGPVPEVPASTVELASGSSVDVPVSWNATGLAGGTYDGFLSITGASSRTIAKVPYWYAANSGIPAHITVLDRIGKGKAGSLERQAILFRMTDESGLILPGVEPKITVISGGGAVRAVSSYDKDAPGVFGIDVELGSGKNIIQIQAGDAIAEATISGE
jgi:minor extracellular serine protease Vpr